MLVKFSLSAEIWLQNQKMWHPSKIQLSDWVYNIGRIRVFWQVEDYKTVQS